MIDPAQEDARVANWATVTSPTDPNSAPQWQKVVATGTASSSVIYIYMSSPGDVYIDDIRIVAGPNPDVGDNTVPDGDFESGFPATWNISPNLTDSVLDTTVKHSGNASLHVISSSAGTTKSSAIWQDIGPLVDTDTYTLSFWYLPSTNGSAVTVRLSGSGISATQNIAPVQLPLLLSTPGAPNSVRATLSALPPVWINELEPNSQTGALDNAGQVEPWLELYNAGTTPVDLSGWYLTDDLTNLTRWAFPSGTLLAPQAHFVVWLDGQPEQATATALHTNFRALPGDGLVALVFPMAGNPTLLDYLKYTAPQADSSIGLYPDGQPGAIVSFPIPTPGKANVDPLSYVHIAGVAVTAGNFNLTWDTQVGATYKIQSMDDLAQAQWTDLATITAINTTSVFSESLSAHAHRFYRVLRTAGSTP